MNLKDNPVWSWTSGFFTRLKTMICLQTHLDFLCVSKKLDFWVFLPSSVFSVFFVFRFCRKLSICSRFFYSDTLPERLEDDISFCDGLFSEAMLVSRSVIIHFFRRIARFKCKIFWKTSFKLIIYSENHAMAFSSITTTRTPLQAQSQKNSEPHLNRSASNSQESRLVDRPGTPNKPFFYGWKWWNIHFSMVKIWFIIQLISNHFKKWMFKTFQAVMILVLYTNLHSKLTLRSNLIIRNFPKAARLSQISWWAQEL